MPLAYTWGIQVEDTNLGRVAQAMTGGIVGALAMLAQFVLFQILAGGEVSQGAGLSTGATTPTHTHLSVRAFLGS